MGSSAAAAITDSLAGRLRGLLLDDGDIDGALKVAETSVFGTVEVVAGADAVLSGLCMSVSAERTPVGGGGGSRRWAAALWELLESGEQREKWWDATGRAAELRLSGNGPAATAVLSEGRRRLGAKSADTVAGLLLPAAACAGPSELEQSQDLFLALADEARWASVVVSCCSGTATAREWAVAAVVTLFQYLKPSGLPRNSTSSSGCIPALGALLSSGNEASRQTVLRICLTAARAGRICACGVWDVRRRRAGACKCASPPTTPWHSSTAGAADDPEMSETGAAWLVLLGHAVRWSVNTGRADDSTAIANFLRLVDEHLLSFLQIPVLRTGIAFVACLCSLAQTGLPAAEALLARAVLWAAELLGPSDGGSPRQRYVASLLLTVDLPAGYPTPPASSIRQFLNHDPEAAILRTWIDAVSSGSGCGGDGSRPPLYPHSPAYQAHAVFTSTGAALLSENGCGGPVASPTERACFGALTTAALLSCGCWGAVPRDQRPKCTCAHFLDLEYPCVSILRLCCRLVDDPRPNDTVVGGTNGDETMTTVNAMSDHQATSLMGALDAVLEWLAHHSSSFAPILLQRAARFEGDNGNPPNCATLIRSLLRLRIKLSARVDSLLLSRVDTVSPPILPIRAAVALLETLLNEKEVIGSGRRATSRRSIASTIDSRRKSDCVTNKHEEMAHHLCGVISVAFDTMGTRETKEGDDDARLRAIASGVPLSMLFPESEVLFRGREAMSSWGREAATLVGVAERLLCEGGRSSVAAAVLRALGSAMEMVVSRLVPRGSVGPDAVRLPSRIVGAGWVASDEWSDGRRRVSSSFPKGSGATAQGVETVKEEGRENKAGEECEEEGLPSQPSSPSYFNPSLTEFGSIVSAVVGGGGDAPASQRNQRVCSAALRAVLPSAGRMQWTALKSCLAALPLGCLLLAFLDGFALCLVDSSCSVTANEHATWARLLSALGELAIAEESHYLARTTPPPPAVVAKAASQGTLPSALASRWLESLWMLRRPATVTSSTDIAPLTAAVLSFLRPKSLSPPILAAAIVTLSRSRDSAIQAHATMSTPHHPRWGPLVAAVRKFAWWGSDEMTAPRVDSLLPMLVTQLESLVRHCASASSDSAWAEASLGGCLLPLSQAVWATLEAGVELPSCTGGDLSGGKDANERAALARAVASVATLGAKAARILISEIPNGLNTETRRSASDEGSAVQEGDESSNMTDDAYDWSVVDIAAAVWVAWLLVRDAMRARYPALQSRRAHATTFDEAEAETFQLAVSLTYHTGGHHSSSDDAAAGDEGRRAMRSRSSNDLNSSWDAVLSRRVSARVRGVVQSAGLPMEPYVGLGAGLGFRSARRPAGDKAVDAAGPSTIRGRLSEQTTDEMPGVERPVEMTLVETVSQGAIGQKDGPRTRKPEKRKVAAVKSANPFIRAVMSRVAEEELSSSEGSEDEEDTFSDLEDFIVCNPDKDYDRMLQHRINKKTKTKPAGDG